MRRTLINIGNLGGALTSLVFAVSFLFAANVNADFVSGTPATTGLEKIFELTMYRPNNADQNNVSITFNSGFGANLDQVGTTPDFTISGLTGLALQYLSFTTPNRTAAGIFEPIKLDGATLSTSGLNHYWGTVLNDTNFYFEGFEANTNSFTLTFGGLSVEGPNWGTEANASVFTITGYGRHPAGITPADASAPEPATMLMFGLGIAGVAVARRIRRK